MSTTIDVWDVSKISVCDVICRQVAVSVRLCMDDDAALLERPSKRQRLVPVSTRNPTPAPEALPEMAWSGWAEVAKEAGLNDAHGPGLVHGIAQLYAKQQRYAALASKQRPQSPLPVNAELQRLTPMLRLAQASNGACSSCFLPEHVDQNLGALVLYQEQQVLKLAAAVACRWGPCRPVHQVRQSSRSNRNSSTKKRGHLATYAPHSRRDRRGLTACPPPHSFWSRRPMSWWAAFLGVLLQPVTTSPKAC
jgi:hypothetical protein